MKYRAAEVAGVATVAGTAETFLTRNCWPAGGVRTMHKLLLFLFLLLPSPHLGRSSFSFSSSSSSSSSGTTFLVLAMREQKFAMEPQDQTAIVGSRVTLPCRVIDKTGILQWTKDDFGLGTHRNLSGFDRYSMIGSDEEGDFSLDIYPVILDDDAKYQCQVSPGPLGQPGIRSHYATITVLVPPEPPKIVQGDYLVTTEDREIELECISHGGKPAAEITWIDGLGSVLTQGIEYIAEELSDGRRFTAKSILKLTPRKEHHNTTFTCQAQNTAERTHRSAKLKLEVKYAPKVTLSIVSALSAVTGRISEGEQIRLRCKSDANPPAVTFEWFMNDKKMPKWRTTDILIENATRALHDAIIKCEVHNVVGKSEESVTLDIAYGPHFRTRPRSAQAEIGTTVTLVCDVDGNPLPDISWYHEDLNTVIGTSPNLTIRVDKHVAGRYMCKAHVAGYADITAEASVYVKGPPTIVPHRSQFGIEGDNVRVECTVFSIPAPERVIWTFNGREVDLHDQDYSILEDPLPEGIKSTLIIRESQERHFGMYNCSVANPYGYDVMEINLMPQKTFPLLMIIVGIVGAVIVVIIVIMIIFLCQRQTNHKKPPPPSHLEPADTHAMEKQCKESDRSSNISDLKLDLRTGSSNSNVHCDMDYIPGAESETGSESVITRIGVPLAGPVNVAGQEIYRYSSAVAAAAAANADYNEPPFPPKDGQLNNGYVPYVDYSRDYNPTLLQQQQQQSSLHLSHLSPSVQSSHQHLHHDLISRSDNNNVQSATRLHLTSLHSGGAGSCSSMLPLNELQHIPNGGAVIDPRFSATYGNPYLRSGASAVGLPTPNTANPVVTPAPPPYTRMVSTTSSSMMAPSVRCHSSMAPLTGSGTSLHLVTANGTSGVRTPTSANQYIVSNSSSMKRVVGGHTMATHV